MRERGRIENSLFNLFSGFGYRLLSIVTAFAVRTVFILTLDSVYLGVNGLYSNVLSMLSLAELGFGSAMVFSMYQPLADKNEEKLNQLVALYKRVYSIIGTVILGLGLALVPFLDHLIKDKPNIDNLTLYYLLFLFNSVSSYWFFAYKISILSADQKTYVLNAYNCVFNIIKTAAQIIILLLFHSFELYLVTQITCTIGQNICASRFVSKHYPYLKTKPERELPKREKSKIFSDVKALMLTKISHIALSGTDNIIISAFVGITHVGLLSNFVMISDAVTSVLCQITGAITGSLGNFFAKETKAEGYSLFKKVDFLNFWLYGFSLVAFIVLLKPLVTIWLGSGYVISDGCIIWLSINFFVAGFMNTLWTFRSTLGLFVQGKYRPLICATINIGLSIILSQFWGMTGVLAATSISRACVNLWYDPWLIHRSGFQRSVKPYYKTYIGRMILLAFIVLLMKLISNIVFYHGITILRFVIMICVTAVLPNAIMILLYHKTDEYRYSNELVSGIFREGKNRFLTKK